MRDPWKLLSSFAPNPRHAGLTLMCVEASSPSSDDQWTKLNRAGAKVSLTVQAKLYSAKAVERSQAVQISDGLRKRSEHGRHQSAGRLQFWRRVRLPRSEL